METKQALGDQGNYQPPTETISFSGLDKATKEIKRQSDESIALNNSDGLMRSNFTLNPLENMG